MVNSVIKPVDLREDLEFKIANPISEEELPEIKISQLIPFYPITTQMHLGTPIKDVLDEKEHDREYLELVLEKPTENVFEFDLVDSIEVKYIISRKQPRECSQLRKSLEEKDMHLEEVVDLEFFEVYPEQKEFIRWINGDKNQRYDKFPQNLIEVIEKGANSRNKRISEFYEIISGGNILNVIKYLGDNQKMDSKWFTSFLDTEKIHMQFAKVRKEDESKYVLAYFGFGNYYPFTRKINKKGSNGMRLGLVNKMSGDNAYFEAEFKKESDTIQKELLSRLDKCQQAYPNYFETNFSYDTRRQAFMEKTGDNNLLPEIFEKLMMLNPGTRNRANAYIAYRVLQETVCSQPGELDFSKLYGTESVLEIVPSNEPYLDVVKEITGKEWFKIPNLEL